MRNRVGIFGGAFNPVHKGHVRAANSFLKSGLIDELLVLPTPTPPHKSSDGLVGFKHRVEMLKRAFSGFKDVTVSDLESQFPEPSYTLQTINYLYEEYPKTRFYLCLGEDSIVHFENWYMYKEILKKIVLLVAERPGFDSSKIPDEILERAIFVNHEPVDLSSSEFRDSESGSGLTSLPEPVRAYIEKHNLYRK